MAVLSSHYSLQWKLRIALILLRKLVVHWLFTKFYLSKSNLPISNFRSTLLSSSLIALSADNYFSQSYSQAQFVYHALKNTVRMISTTTIDISQLRSQEETQNRAWSKFWHNTWSNSMMKIRMKGFNKSLITTGRAASYITIQICNIVLVLYDNQWIVKSFLTTKLIIT